MEKDKTSVGRREAWVKGAEMQNDSRILNAWETQRSAKKQHMRLLLAPPSENALWSTKMPLKVVQKQCSADTSLWKNMGIPSFHCKIQKHYKTLSITQTLQSEGDSSVQVFIWWFCWCCCIRLPHTSSGPSLLLSVHLLQVSVARSWTSSERSLGCVSRTRSCMENSES